MSIEDEVTFSGSPPRPEVVLEKIIHKSGLADVAIINSKGGCYQIAHPLFKNREFFITSEKNTIYLLRGWDNPHYLFEITISSLIDLGGVYRGQLRQLTNEKWEKVRSSYSRPLAYNELERLNIVEEVQFENELPTWDQLLEKIKEISGIPDLILSDQFGNTKMIEHPFFDRSKSFLMGANKTGMHIERNQNASNYLLEITLSAITDLGGVYKGNVRSFTHDKWQLVKHKYVD